MPYRHAPYYILVCIAVIAAGFWESYFSKWTAVPWQFHAHGVAASIWVLMVLFQSWAVHKEQLPIHRAVGKSSLLLFPFLIGGLAGSFAVLAGAAAVSPAPGPEALWLAVVLFLWTPPHFWSLAIVCREDYAKAGVPMLPVVVGDERAARAIFASALLLVAASLVPAAYGLGWIYLAAAAAGGLHFLLRCHALVRRPARVTARAAFLASLAQLGAVLAGAMLDAAILT